MKCDIIWYMVAFLFDSFPLHPLEDGGIQVAHLAHRAGASDTLAVCGVDFAWAAIKAERFQGKFHTDLSIWVFPKIMVPPNHPF